MSLSTITLPTNKSISVVDDDRRRLRQSEKGLVLTVILLDANGSAYDLTDKQIVFSENKDGGKVIIDDGTGAGSGSIRITDAKAGKFEYTLQQQVYTNSGTCWFEIKTGDTVIDTTKNFYFDVDKDAAIQPLNDSYISRVQALEDHLQGVVQKAEQSITSVSNDLTSTSNKAKQDAINQINTAKNNATSTLNSLKSQYNDYQNRYNSLQSQWNAQKQSIQKAADDQRASIKATNDKARTDAINQINSARDSAIKTANDNFNKKLGDLQNDYNSWKTKTVADFNAQAKKITDSINAQNNNISAVQKQLSDTQSQMSNLLKQFNSVDFSRFLKEVDTSPQNSGVNLFSNTQNKLVVKGSGTVNQDVDFYPLARAKLSDFGIGLGDKITLSFDWYATDTAGKLSGTFNANEINQTPWGWSGYSNPVRSSGVSDGTHVRLSSSNSKGHVIMVFEIKQSDLNFTSPSNRVRFDSVPTTTTVTIEHFQVVKGEKALPYHPAVEDSYTKQEIDSKVAAAGKVKTVDGKQPDGNGNINTDHYTRGETDNKLNGKVNTGDFNNLKNQVQANSAKTVIHKFKSPQEAFDWSKTGDGIAIYDPDDGPTQAVIGDQVVTISSLKKEIDALSAQSGNFATKGDLQSLASSTTITNLQNQINTANNQLGSLNKTVNGKANSQSVTDLQNLVNQIKSKVDKSKNEWTGTSTQYDAIANKDPNTIYYISD